MLETFRCGKRKLRKFNSPHICSVAYIMAVHRQAEFVTKPKHGTNNLFREFCPTRLDDNALWEPIDGRLVIRYSPVAVCFLIAEKCIWPVPKWVTRMEFSGSEKFGSIWPIFFTSFFGRWCLLPLHRGHHKSNVKVDIGWVFYF